MNLSQVINPPSNPVNVDLAGSFLTYATPFFLVSDSAANTAQTLSIPGEADRSHYIAYVNVALSGADSATEVVITVKDGNSTKYKTFIGLGAKRGTVVQFTLPYPIAISVGSAANISATAAGAGAITTINAGGYTL